MAEHQHGAGRASTWSSRLQYLKYSNYYARRDAVLAGHDYPADTGARRRRRRSTARTRRSTRRGCRAATRARLLAYADAAATDGTAATTAAARRQRFYALQALMLGGPDGQVM